MTQIVFTNGFNRGLSDFGLLSECNNLYPAFDIVNQQLIEQRLFGTPGISQLE